ncbi:MAG: imelysin family protein [Cocleimonas sp.]|nr:imelysin family protein [Cocleimonas sp.]
MNKLLLLILLSSVSSVLAAADWSKSNLDVVDQFAIPSYQTLQKNSQQLIQSSQAFCSNANEKQFNTLKKSFHETMDAWQIAQIFRSGPAMQKMRFYRLEMWPDRSNAAAKHLRKLQKEANPDSLKAENFSKASTAIQGLSALERILYAKAVTPNDFQEKGKANFKCQLVQTISLNIHTISTELLKAWEQDFRNLIRTPSKDNTVFESHKSVAAQFLNDLNTQLQVILTQKFKRPLNGKNFRLTRAESWRSQRSLRNILFNLKASNELYKIIFLSHINDEKLQQKQQQLFEQALKLGKDLALPLQDAHQKHSEKLTQWIAAIGALNSSMNSELPIAIDIPLGFNSLDGD